MICASSHMPSPDTPALKEAAELWLCKVLEGVCIVTKPVMSRQLEEETLLKWMDAVTDTSMARCRRCFETTAIMTALFKDASPLFVNVQRMEKLTTWLGLAASLFAQPEAGEEALLHDVKATQAGFVQQSPHTHPFVKDGSPHTPVLATGLAAMFDSPLFGNDGAYSNRVSEMLTRQGASAVGPLVDEIGAIPRKMCFLVIEFEKSGDEELQAWATMATVCDEDKVRTAKTWADETQDDFLRVTLEAQ